MKREIKFRGFNTKNNKWLYGDLIHNRGLTFVCPVGIADPFETWKDFVVETESVGQFTGLKDVKGKRIFEGDIIESPDYRHLILYNDNLARFVDTVEGKKYSTCGINQVWINGFEKVIVGNVYENSELIKTE